MIETHVDGATEVVERERAALTEQGAAYEEFRRRVASLSTTERRPGSAGATVHGGGAARTARADTGGAACERVRETFAETVRPHSIDDVGEEPLLETIREELGDGVALALAPTTDAGFTPKTKQAVLTAARERSRGIEATLASIDSERESLEGAADVVAELTEWLVAADETPLSSLGFDALRDRHERLAAYRARCDSLLTERQELLASTTGRNGSADVTHRSLVRYLYSSFPVVYPVLSTVTRLADLLGDCQRAVRSHLTRRA